MDIVTELNIDWQGLYTAFQANAAECKCFLNLDDGIVVKLDNGDEGFDTIRNSPGKFRSIEVVPSRIQYQWVTEFVKSIEHEPIQSRMTAAINGKGAFRRFKDILLTLPDERRRWFEFRDKKMRQRVSDWIEENGIRPTNPPKWKDILTGSEEDIEAIERLRTGVDETVRNWIVDQGDAVFIGEKARSHLIDALFTHFIISKK